MESTCHDVNGKPRLSGSGDSDPSGITIAPATKVEETHHLLRGQPELVIPDFSRNEHIDAIVLGSAGKTGIAGLLVGEMAEEILSRVQCGVFCIKPDGFVSPVSLGKAPAAASKTARAAGGPAQDQAHG